jgi:hypothetical protein
MQAQSYTKNWLFRILKDLYAKRIKKEPESFGKTVHWDQRQQ